VNGDGEGKAFWVDFEWNELENEKKGSLKESKLWMISVIEA
jgi:hypothetical protein